MTKRAYRGTAQAEVAALTRQRILDAVNALAADYWIDEITLDKVAEKAGVTVQTILRHFGSKDGMAAEVARQGNNAVLEQRNAAIPGDLHDITENLIEHYEALGDRVHRTLAQDDVYPQLKAFLQEGRSFHRQWVERVFEPWLVPLDAETRERRMIQLITMCDVYVWKLMRRDLNLSVEQYRLTLRDMLQALLCQSSGDS